MSKKMLEVINGAPLTPSLLGEVLRALAELPAEDRRDYATQVITVIRVLEDPALPDAPISATFIIVSSLGHEARPPVLRVFSPSHMDRIGERDNPSSSAMTLNRGC